MAGVLRRVRRGWGAIRHRRERKKKKGREKRKIVVLGASASLKENPGQSSQDSTGMEPPGERRWPPARLPGTKKEENHRGDWQPAPRAMKQTVENRRRLQDRGPAGPASPPSGRERRKFPFGQTELKSLRT